MAREELPPIRVRVRARVRVRVRVRGRVRQAKRCQLKQWGFTGFV